MKSYAKLTYFLVKVITSSISSFCLVLKLRNLLTFTNPSLGFCIPSFLSFISDSLWGVLRRGRLSSICCFHCLKESIFWKHNLFSIISFQNPLPKRKYLDVMAWVMCSFIVCLLPVFMLLIFHPASLWTVCSTHKGSLVLFKHTVLCEACLCFFDFVWNPFYLCLHVKI